MIRRDFSGQQNAQRNNSTQRSKTPQKIIKLIGNYNYDLADKIGSGFSSDVYKGKNSINGEVVAIKVINLQQMTTPISKTLLKNEILVLRQLNHQNLLKVHDIHLTSNNTYIISEYCDQGDLSDLIHRNKKLDEKSAISLLTQILQGMKELELQQIIHRDIKPANILMSNGVPKLADFGFAINQTQQLDKSIMSGFNVGTPLYMAPETILYNEYSLKSDIWSLGVVLFEMLHGFPPFKAPSDSSLLNSQLTKPVDFSKSLHISLEMKNIIQNMLTVDQNERYDIDQVLKTNEENRNKRSPSSFIQNEERNRNRPSFLKPKLVTFEDKQNSIGSNTPQNQIYRQVFEKAQKIPLALNRRSSPYSKKNLISPRKSNFSTNHLQPAISPSLRNISFKTQDSYVNLTKAQNSQQASLSIIQAGYQQFSPDFFPTFNSSPSLRKCSEREEILEIMIEFQQKKIESVPIQLTLNENNLIIELLCKQLKSIADKLENFVIRSFSSSPPSYFDQLSILAMKCTFLFWKCMAIKSYHYEDNFSAPFRQRYQQLLVSSYLHNLLDGDRRFEVLFDEQIEDDCSGFYAILCHYISELIKHLSKSIQRQQNVDDDQIEIARLIKKLLILKKVLSLHLKQFDLPNQFNLECLTDLQQVDNFNSLNKLEIAEILDRAQNNII